MFNYEKAKKKKRGSNTSIIFHQTQTFNELKKTSGPASLGQSMLNTQDVQIDLMEKNN